MTEKRQKATKQSIFVEYEQEVYIILYPNDQWLNYVNTDLHHLYGTAVGEEEMSLPVKHS